MWWKKKTGMEWTLTDKNRLVFAFKFLINFIFYLILIIVLFDACYIACNVLFGQGIICVSVFGIDNLNRLQLLIIL